MAIPTEAPLCAVPPPASGMGWLKRYTTRPATSRAAAESPT